MNPKIKSSLLILIAHCVFMSWSLLAQSISSKHFYSSLCHSFCNLLRVGIRHLYDMEYLSTINAMHLNEKYAVAKLDNRAQLRKVWLKNNIRSFSTVIRLFTLQLLVIFLIWRRFSIRPFNIFRSPYSCIVKTTSVMLRKMDLSFRIRNMLVTDFKILLSPIIFSFIAQTYDFQFVLVVLENLFFEICRLKNELI